MANDSTVLLPFYTDFGRRIKIGKNVFINCNVMMADYGSIVIQDNVTIGPGVSFLTTEFNDSNHSSSAPIVIKKGVHIGGHAIILAGVTIGRNAVVNPGAIITRDIPGVNLESILN